MRGFTLIELLVVIAIIGVLSSVVLASLNTARLKARDSAVKEQVLQLRTIMNQQFADTGSYAAIKTGGAWKGEGDSCDAATFSGAYATQADQICDGLVETACSGSGVLNNCVYFQTTNPPNDQKYTIMSYLPGASKQAGASQYFCVGSSGGFSVGPVDPGGGSWTGTGCYANP
jgi:prepilin-type N-terminal cleavage/methylation domain-containing protein